MLKATITIGGFILGLSKKLLAALSGFWLQKFNTPIDFEINAESLFQNRKRRSDNVISMILGIQNEMHRLGLEKRIVEHYFQYGFAPIAYYFSMFSSSRYSLEKLKTLTDEIRKHFGTEVKSPQVFRSILKAAEMLEIFHNKGYLNESDLVMSRGTKYKLGDEFEGLISIYIDKIGDYRSLSKHTLTSRCASIRSFLFQFEALGIFSAEEITCSAISDAVTLQSVKYSRHCKNWLHNPKQFFELLFAEGITSTDFSKSFPDTPPRIRTVKPGFTSEEVEKMLNCVNKSKLHGIRDYALMMIGTMTGLRGSDIIGLKFENIDWRLNEIRIVQQKTGVALNLPLSAEVGNAIADYILNARPKSPSDYIFVKPSNPLQHIHRQAVTAVAKKYMRIAGIDDDGGIPFRGFHGFRKGFGLNLLESSVPIDMINELLGHTEMNSSRPYLAIDENGLRNCSLNLIPMIR